MAQCGGGVVAAPPSTCGMAAAEPPATGCWGGEAVISAQATQNEYTYTYVFTGTALEKRKGCGMVVKSVAVDCRQHCQGQVAQAPQMDVEGGYGMAPVASGESQGHAGSCCPKAGPPAGEAATDEGAKADCCRAKSDDGSEMSCAAQGPKLTADAEGVTLRCCAKLLVWDLDLNPKVVEDLGEGCCRF